MKEYAHPAFNGIMRRKTLLKSKKFSVGKVLDVGCSDGAFLSIYPDSEGIDIDKNILKKAEKWGKVKYASVENLPYTDKSFDTIVCNGVLEQTSNMEKALTELARVAKKRIIASFPLKPKKGYGKYLTKIPSITGFKIIHKSYLSSTFRLKYNGKNFNNEEHIELVMKKNWFKIARLLFPILSILFLLYAYIKKDNPFLVYERV